MKKKGGKGRAIKNKSEKGRKGYKKWKHKKSEKG
jgi:hypothetical protein